MKNNKLEKFSIRKLKSVGTASALIGAMLTFPIINYETVKANTVATTETETITLNSTLPMKYVANPNVKADERKLIFGGSETERPITEVGTAGHAISGMIKLNPVYVSNPDMPLGERKTTFYGYPKTSGGKYTYTLNEETGELTSYTERFETPGKPDVIEVGTKINGSVPDSSLLKEGVIPKGIVYSFDLPIKYVSNPDMPLGETELISIGKQRTDYHLIVKWEVEEDTGLLYDSKREIVVTDGKNPILAIGTKPVVETTTQVFNKTIIEDINIPENKEIIETSGVNGTTTIIKTYTVNEDTGELIETIDTKVVEPVNEVIRVGVGKNVVLPFNTKYIADPNDIAGNQIEVETGETGEIDVTGQIVKHPKERVVKVGTQSTTREIPFDRIEIKDSTKPLTYREVTNKGENGTETISYTLNAETGEVVANEPVVTKNKVDEIVTIGTKELSENTNNLEIDTDSDGLTDNEEKELGTDPNNVDTDNDSVSDKEEIEKGTNPIVSNNTNTSDNVLDVPKTYEADNNLEAGTKLVVTPGSEAIKDEKGNIIKEAVPEVVKVGTKPKVIEESTPKKIKFVENNELEAGAKNTIREGKDATETIINYELDSNTGALKEIITNNGEEEVVEVGIKDKTIERPIEFTTEIIENNELLIGEVRVLTEGGNGLEVVKQSHKLNTKTGEVIVANEEILNSTPATKKVVEIGTKIVVSNTDNDSDKQEVGKETNSLVNDKDKLVKNNDNKLLDTDNDGILDADEFVLGTDPNRADTDGDGINDKEEILNKTNPLVKTDNDKDKSLENKNDSSIKSESKQNNDNIISNATNSSINTTVSDSINNKEEVINKTNSLVKNEEVTNKPTTTKVEQVTTTTTNYSNTQSNSNTKELPKTSDSSSLLTTIMGIASLSGGIVVNKRKNKK